MKQIFSSSNFADLNKIESYLWLCRLARCNDVVCVSIIFVRVYQIFPQNLDTWPGPGNPPVSVQSFFT